MLDVHPQLPSSPLEPTATRVRFLYPECEEQKKKGSTQ
jgi:hypothetical protein